MRRISITSVAFAAGSEPGSRLEDPAGATVLHPSASCRFDATPRYAARGWRKSAIVLRRTLRQRCRVREAQGRGGLPPVSKGSRGLPDRDATLRACRTAATLIMKPVESGKSNPCTQLGAGPGIKGGRDGR